MADIGNEFSLSKKASEVADKFLERKYFDSASDVAVFAASYVVKNYYSVFNPANYEPSDSKGYKYSYGTFDKDGIWKRVIESLYQTDEYRRYMRNLMVYGLEKMGDIIEEKQTIDIEDFF